MKAARFFLFVLAFSVMFSGCSCLRNAINADEGTRWFLFSNFGASKVCPEMLKKGVPLKLALLGTNSVGRFFPLQCAARVDDATRTMRLDITGNGYVTLPFTKRVGFYAGMVVEFRPDFRMEEDALYLWGKYNRTIQAPDLRLLGVENPIIQLATQTPAGNVATILGKLVVESELSRGFTVVREDSGDSFALGILTPPAKPTQYFQSTGDHVVMAQDIVTLQAQGREYLGPIEVASDNAAIYATLRVAGATVDYSLVSKQLGDAWMQPYLAAQPLAAPPATPIAGGQAMGDHRRTFTVPRGYYYLVAENRAPSATAVLGMPLPFEQVATVTYSLEVGSR